MTTERYRHKIIDHSKAKLKKLLEDVRRLRSFDYRITTTNDEGFNRYNVEVWDGSKFIRIITEALDYTQELEDFIKEHELENLTKGQRG